MVAPRLGHVGHSGATWGRLGPIVDALEIHMNIYMFWKSLWGGGGGGAFGHTEATKTPAGCPSGPLEGANRSSHGSIDRHIHGSSEPYKF